MNVLFISYDGLTDPLGQSQILPYLIRLTQFGHTFTVLSCDKPEKYAQFKTTIENIIKPYPISWRSLPYTKKPPILSTLKDYKKMVSEAEKIISQQKINMTHCRSGVGGLVGLFLKKKYNTAYLNDIRGFYADERVDGGMWNLSNPLYKLVYNFFKKKEKEALDYADYNVCLTYKAKDEIRSRADIKKNLCIDVVPCSVDLELFDRNKIQPGLQEEMANQLGITSEDIVFSYVGSLGGWYMTDEMLKFCGIIFKKEPNAKFLFLTNNGLEQVAAKAGEFGIPKDRIIVKFGKRNEMPILLSLSKFSIFFIKPAYSKISSSPTKHGEIMALGIPVITNRGVGDVDQIVSNTNSGYLISEFREDYYQRAADEILQNRITFNAAEIRKGAEAYYDLEKTVNVYKKVYADIEKNIA